MKRARLSARGMRAGELIEPMYRRTKLSREQGYTLCSRAADLRVTQVE